MEGAAAFGVAVMRGIMSGIRSPCMAIPVRIWSDFV
jgi:hypothetical protein